MREKAASYVRQFKDSGVYREEIYRRLGEAETTDELMDLRLEVSEHPYPFPPHIKEMIKEIDKKLTKMLVDAGK